MPACLIKDTLRPAPLLMEHAHLFSPENLEGPVLDLACGSGHNGIFLAKKGCRVVLCDRSGDALERARDNAHKAGAGVGYWQVDLETGVENPLRENYYGALLVFRYLHRPLIPCIKKALKAGGLLVYETFTLKQAKLGKPRNPAFLLGPYELEGWFRDWKILHYFEGTKEKPPRAIAQIVCKKPAKRS